MFSHDPHKDSPIFTASANPPQFTSAAIFVHGRGGSAAEFLLLSKELLPRGVAAFAPQARDCTWYPASFLAPGDVNQAGRASAHRLIEQMIERLGKRGVARERIALVGFSQGACVVADHLHQFPARYGAAVCFIGGLIGPLGTTYNSSGSLKETPVLLASADPVPHVPWSRVEETAGVLNEMGANVTLHRSVGCRMQLILSGWELHES